MRTNTASVSAIVTAYKRVGQTMETLRILSACEPAPSEILVHVDANQTDTLRQLRAQFPCVRYLLTEGSIGPGGGRNKLIAAATQELVASFDDDSYPIDQDYFARVVPLAEALPEAAIIVGRVFHQGEAMVEAKPSGEWSSDFCGGACIYRRAVFLSTSGYVPLPTAYGMEEVDLALRLHASGQRIFKTPWLRVFHDTDLKHHADPEVTASSIANLFLLSFLRYPFILWPIGLAQVTKRVAWLVTHGRCPGVLTGLCRTPVHLYNNRSHRQPLSIHAVRSYLRLRRHPISVQWPESMFSSTAA